MTEQQDDLRGRIDARKTAAELTEAMDRRLGEFTRWSLVTWAVNTALILGLYFK
jgi:hypothetical protein